MSERRPPPQSIEAEKQVLGAMLQFPMAIGDAIEGLGKHSKEVWYHGGHRLIFETVLKMYDLSEPVDITTVSAALKRQGKLDEVGGEVYLAELASGCATALTVPAHCKDVLRTHALRSIGTYGAQMHDLSHRTDADPVAIADTFTGNMLHLIHGESAGAEEMEPIMASTLDEMQRAQDLPDGEIIGLDTGYFDLNDMTAGFQNSDLVILAARPSVGKTALALSFLLKAATSSKGRALLFSLEMSRVQVGQRLLSIESGVDLQRMRTGKLNDEEWAQAAASSSRLAALPITVDDTSGITVLEARAKSRRLAQKEDISVVVVDYLQLMSGDPGMNREQQIATISRGLKALAKDLDVPVLALSQLSRATEARQDRRPQLSDLRESGAIEQDADVVMFIYRPDLYGLLDKDGASTEGVAEVIIGKQRNGPTGHVNLHFDANSATFRNAAPRHTYQRGDNQ